MSTKEENWRLGNKAFSVSPVRSYTEAQDIVII